MLTFSVLFLSSRCRLFHNAIFFGSCNIHILNTECAKIKKKTGAKWLSKLHRQKQECTNPGAPIRHGEKFYTVAPNVCGFSAGNLLHCTIWEPVIFRLFL